MTFVNKGMADTVSKTFQMKDVIDSLPFNFQEHGNIPATTYKLIAIIRNKVLESTNSRVNRAV